MFLKYEEFTPIDGIGISFQTQNIATAYLRSTHRSLMNTEYGYYSWKPHDDHLLISGLQGLNPVDLQPFGVCLQLARMDSILVARSTCTSVIPPEPICQDTHDTQVTRPQTSSLVDYIRRTYPIREIFIEKFRLMHYQGLIMQL